MTASLRRLLVSCAVASLSATAVADTAIRTAMQDGPAGYSVACSIDEEPAIQSCAGLPSAAGCAYESDFASHPSNDATGMTFVNRSGVTVRIYWLDRQGYRQLYHTLPPGGRATQKTSIGANWLVATRDDQCIGVFKAAPVSVAFF